MLALARRIAVRPPDRLKRAVERDALLRGVSQAELIRSAISAGVRHPRPSPGIFIGEAIAVRSRELLAGTALRAVDPLFACSPADRPGPAVAELPPPPQEGLVMPHPSDELIARNERFAADFDGAGLGALGNGTIILTCMDSRVDPAGFLGLQPGEALVLRSVGGRASGEILDQLRMAAALAAGTDLEPAVLVIHHTNCGTARFLQPEMQETLASLGAPVEAAAARAVVDPGATVATDVDLVRSAVPDGWPVRGFVYDVSTGRLRGA